ncbi:hypothetical protein GC173_08155 [bacterium]|nr:hypothetical protein [bacterium]
MALVGLQINLDGWRKGVREAGAIVKSGLNARVLSPFGKAVDRTIAKLKGGVRGAANFIKGALTSAFVPLFALLAVGAIFETIKRVVAGSLAAFREYSDSVTMLKASLSTLGDRVNVDKATAQVKELGSQLRLALGITGAETNRTFATFVTRGFDVGQARQLTILAANYAKKSGKPIADVTKMIADAANGGVDAMKELGVQITATGNRVKDGEAAVLALKGAYGDIGGELANPSERLAAAWNELAVSLGEKISPLVEPLIQGFSDFVTGLSQTEEGQAALQGIADTLKWILEEGMKLIRFVVNFTEVVKGTGQVIWDYLNQLFNQIVAALFDKLRELPGGDFLLEKMGFDPESASQAFRDGAAAAQESLKESTKGLLDSQRALVTGGSGSLLSGVESIMEAGKTAREEAAKSLAAEMAATRSETFAGNPAREAERQKAKAALESRVKAYSPAEGGQQVRVGVQVVSSRPDRYRKARMA